MLDVVTHLVLLGVDLWWWSGLRRGASPWPWTVLLGGVGSLAAGAVAAFGWGDGFAVMRAVAWVWFVHGPLVLAALALHRRSALAAGGAAGLIAVAVDAFFVEPYSLQIRTETIAVAGLTTPVRVVVLSDIQTDAIGGFERRVAETASALSPSLIVLPGDFVQVQTAAEYKTQVERFRTQVLPHLRAPLGVWAVKGNSERERWAEDLFGGTHVRAFDATHTENLGPLTLSALSFRDGFGRNTVLPKVDGPHVAFAHAPDFSLSAGVDADVLIAGHTHGGQVQIPWLGPLLTLSHVDRSAAAGVPKNLGDGRTLVVSRGIGMERGHAPRLRFFCRPEVLVIDLVPG